MRVVRGATHMTVPLAGLRILDLGALCRQRPHALAASMAGKLCCAYGAEVVRPLPPAGEPLADAAPLLPDGSSALDRFLNAGKHIGASGDGFDAAIGDTAALAALANVPITVRFSVFGPGEDPPTTELALLALSGILEVVGESGQPPARLAGHQPAYAAALAAITALLAALRSRARERIEISLFDVCAWLNWKVAGRMLVDGKTTLRGGPDNDWFTLPAADGHVALVYQEKDWPPLRDLIGDSALAGPDFATMPARRRNRDALVAILTPWFRARTRMEITRAAQARRVPIGPVLWPAELLSDAQYRARGFLAEDGAPHLPVIWNGRRPGDELQDAA